MIVAATASTFWPDQITVGHVVFDFPAPYLPHLEPSLLFLRPFPAVSGHQHTSSSLDGVTLYSTEGNDWYPYLSCGWFPVLVIYPNLQPILAHAWVHVSPSFLTGPPGCTPPMFGARTLSTNNIYVGRQFIHTFRSSAAV